MRKKKTKNKKEEKRRSRVTPFFDSFLGSKKELGSGAKPQCYYLGVEKASYKFSALKTVLEANEALLWDKRAVAGVGKIFPDGTAQTAWRAGRYLAFAVLNDTIKLKQHKRKFKEQSF